MNPVEIEQLTGPAAEGILQIERALDLLREKGAASAEQLAQSARSFAELLQQIGRSERELSEQGLAQKEAELKKLLEKYRTFQQQRVALEAKAKADIAALDASRTAGNAPRIDQAKEEVNRQLGVGLRGINDAEAKSITADNDFFKQLFGDYSSLSFGALGELLEQARQLDDYLRGMGSAEGITFIEPEELERIKESPTELDKTRSSLSKLLKANPGNKWEKIFRDFEKGFDELNGAGGMRDIAGAIATISGAAAGAAGELSKMFEEMGESSIAETIGGVQQVMSAVSNIGEGFAKGGIVGGIGAAVGEAANFLGQAFAAEARHRKALKEIERQKLAFQRQYNLSLMEQNLLMEEASNSFGERSIQKAAGAMAVYRKAYEELSSALAGNEKGHQQVGLLGLPPSGAFLKAVDAYAKGLGGLYEAKIVTGHKKTGLFGWGKGEDVYGSILSEYEGLIDKNGELDTTLLQTILDTRKMSDETRKYLENLVDLKEMMDQADQALTESIQQTFGSLGTGLMESITAALRSSEGVLAGFADNAAAVFEQLGQQVAYSLFLADHFDALEKRLKEVYGSGRSEEEIASEAMAVVDSFYENIGGEAEAAKKWMEQWQQRAQEMGYDLWEDSAQVAQRGPGEALTTMTQEQGSRLEGLFTSLQMHSASIDAKVDNITSGLGGCLDTLGRIASNTDTLPAMLALVQGIRRDGLKIR